MTTDYKSIPLILFMVLIFCVPASAADTDAEASSSEEVTLERKEGSEDEWELRNQGGEVLAVVKSKELQSFKIYDTSGTYLGYVYESENWVPQGARQKRELRIGTHEIELYLQILKAAGADSTEVRKLTLVPRENAEGEYELHDENQETVGTVQKAEVSFKLYDGGGNFMGYIYSSGFWMPKLNINRREMRITPEQARFSLEAMRAISGSN